MLANAYGNKTKALGQIPLYYFERVKRILQLTSIHGIIRDGSKVLEIGTGWLHWDAMIIRLFYEVEATLFDVWDNRQILGFKNYLRQLRSMLSSSPDLASRAAIERACRRIDIALRVESFEELYNLFGFQYVIDESGSLGRFSDNSFDLIVSGGVLEHVPVDTITTLVHDTYRILKPGGWVLHGINTSDHLAHYDKRVSQKHYLSVPEWIWRALFQNRVQYINRIQKGEWLNMFGSSGFIVKAESEEIVDIARLKLATKFKGLNRSELQQTVIQVLLKKG